MILNIKDVFNTTGLSKELDFKISSDVLEKVKGYGFDGSVSVKGKVFNRADIVNARFSTEFTLRLVCDRCLKEFERNYSFDFEHTIVKSLNNSDNDEYIVADGDCVDFGEVALSDILLELPAKILCRDDCKGLCMVCGQDLNESECDCLS
jgi:uncharacterized protein